MTAGFDEVVLPHLDAARRLARWLMRNQDDADDAVQEASLRAYRYFRTFTGGSGRAWFLSIVRNTCYGWRGHVANGSTEHFDEEQHSNRGLAHDPETLLLQADDVVFVRQALTNLPAGFRDVLRLRELDGLSYQEMADAMNVPIGTVMSRLSRARRAFRSAMNKSPGRFGSMVAEAGRCMTATEVL